MGGETALCAEAPSLLRVVPTRVYLSPKGGTYPGIPLLRWVSPPYYRPKVGIPPYYRPKGGICLLLSS